MAKLIIRRHPGSKGMAKLVRRLTSRGKQGTSRRANGSELRSKDSKSRCQHLNWTYVPLVIFACMLVGILSFPDAVGNLQKSVPPSSNASNEMSYDIAPGMHVSIKFNRVDSSKAPSEIILSLGEHEAKITFAKPCERDSIWLRIIGDALQNINLMSDSSTRSLTGRFTLPMEGNYAMQLFSNGCGEQTSRQIFNVTTFQVKGETTTNFSTAANEYPVSAWISSKHFPQVDKAIAPEYIWHNPQIPAASANLLKAGNTILSKEGTIRGNGFYDFDKLSNYELVCFVGSDSASRIRESFLQFRPMLFAHQRPFKFHLYPIHYFEKPDRDWEEGKKKGFRKCKHILVSVDELKQKLSQKEYTTQVTTFINHLLNAIPDETFPIWFFTVMESPIQPSNCLPQSLPRDNLLDHPCNIALKSLFHNSRFPSRVKLLDTTEIALPQLGNHPEDVAAAIALRVYVFVGKQVRTWRTQGQEGKKDGLVRGGKIEPNFELIPYTEWS
ncbi:unnamed protein product [Cylindrotheca closterium]|uniref:Uncharacterized protein n=1 Tax=Cylindrotheca closterium TaxID=2856 RepID=A0AAD2FVV2_9STRA|nr:unnamed protein product [Cylindrotheca closterium]